MGVTTAKGRPLANYAATAAPGVGDDSADGYSVGSPWFDTTNDRAYMCLDPTAGAAVWRCVADCYTLAVQALTSAPTDGQTVYFGNLPKAPVTSAAISKVYIPRRGIITRAEVYTYSGTAGSNENWSLYVRLNNTTDTLIQTVGAATNQRIFSNSSLSIAVAAGDYIEIKGVQPTWATNPNTTIYGGYLWIEAT